MFGSRLITWLEAVTRCRTVSGARFGAHLFAVYPMLSRLSTVSAALLLRCDMPSLHRCSCLISRETWPSPLLSI